MWHVSFLKFESSPEYAYALRFLSGMAGSSSWSAFFRTLFLGGDGVTGGVGDGVGKLGKGDVIGGVGSTVGGVGKVSQTDTMALAKFLYSNSIYRVLAAWQAVSGVASPARTRRTRTPRQRRRRRARVRLKRLRERLRTERRVASFEGCESIRASVFERALGRDGKECLM